MMRDQDKTKEQLLNELAEMRQRVSQLQAADTERKRAEEALRESEREKALIFSSVSELIASEDNELRVRWANRAAAESVGLPLDALVGRHCYEIWPQRSEPCIGCPVMKAMETGEPQEQEMTTPDGRVWFIRGYPVREENGDVVGAVEVTHDITERKRAEEERRRLYEQAQRDAEAKAALLREVNHRVKNDLTAIIGLLHLEQEYAKIADQAAYEVIMQSLTTRLSGLATVHSLLSASEWAPLPLSDLAGQVIKSATQIRPSDKQVLVDALPSPVRVTPDQAHNLALVINELATNTIEHALPGRNEARISVRIALEDDGLASHAILFEYRDDGPGYPEDVLRLERHAVGFDLIKNLTRRNLRGELSLRNDEGAVAVIRFPAQALGGTTNGQSKDDPHTDR